LGCGLALASIKENEGVQQNHPDQSKPVLKEKIRTEVGEGEGDASE